ncbi:hypothetical protein SETIT_2G018100v2 [Setaria italica]|uniref:Rx N-terminal domain-containing protein n=1 Tax=Setaria italica TaxID=4555 RepID=A0A368PU50_SETIT|nr:hypothetical protein SETIT_2G018100v2 [Setaria italica]
MEGMVGSAVVQETVSRITSYLFSKCDHDKRTASTGHHIERLEVAHSELELALERSARMPITDVSLLRRWKRLERAFKDCGDLLHRCIKQQTMNVDIEDVESGCSPLRCVFSNPLEYKMAQGKSTDIVGTAIRCLQSFTSSMNDVAEAVMRELIQLPQQDISHSHAASCFTIKDLCSYDTHFWRPDPLCCKPDRCATSCIPSELSCKFQEQVILIRIECYVSAFECSSLHNTADATARNLVADLPPLKLGVGFAPHFFNERTQGRTAVEIIGGKEELINDSLQQMDETVRSKAIKHYICQPDLAYYKMGWYPGHGGAYFMVQKSGTEIARAHKVDCGFDIRGSSKRRRSK